MKKEWKELSLIRNGKKLNFRVEILNKKKRDHSFCLKVLNKNFNEEVKLEEEVELKIIADDYVYFSKSIVVKIEKESNYIYILKPNKLKKVKRRKNKRYNFNVTIEILGSESNYFGKCYDISKGGLGFYSKQFFYIGDILFITLYSEAENEQYNLEIEVKNLFIEKKGIIRYGAEFSACIGNEIDNLIRFLRHKEKMKEIKKQELIKDKVIRKEKFKKNNKQQGFLKKLNLLK